MAVTAGALNGTDLLVYDATNPIAHSTACTLNLSMDMRDTSTKASAGWKAVLPGQRNWSIEVSGLIALDASYNWAYLMALITNKTRVALKFRTANTDNFYYYGYGYLASVSADAPNQGNTTYSASFTGDGELALQSSGA
jgi:predicted secreted protein